MMISPVFSGIPLQVISTFPLPALRPYYYIIVDVIIAIAGHPAFLFPVELFMVDPSWLVLTPVEQSIPLLALQPHYYIIVYIIFAISGHPAYIFPEELFLVEPLLVDYYPSRANQTS
jgi:hypothetical protein